MLSTKRFASGSLFCACALMSSSLPAQESVPGSYEGPKESLHIYLLIGQSNMAGRAPIGEDQTGVINRCYLLNDTDQWEPAQNPLNRYSTIDRRLELQRLGPGDSFARRMLEKNPNIAIGLVVNARGGTKIEQWQKGTPFYDDALRRTQVAREHGTLKGILWHQGESNEKNQEGYLDKLQALIAAFRKDLDAPDLPFVAGQVHDLPTINEQISQLPGLVPSTGFISSERLKTMDRWHFDAASVRLMGERYAEEIDRIQAKAEASGIAH